LVRPPEGPQKSLNEPDLLHTTAPEAKNEESLNPEVAKEMAIKLAQRQKDLINLIPNVDQDTLGDGVFIDTSDAQKLITSFRKAFGDTGKQGFVRLLWQRDELLYPTKMGLDTHFQLVVGIHGDKETREQYEMLMKNGSAKKLQTIYYFTEEGKYGKVCELQPELKDIRIPLITFENLNRIVDSEMNPGDFEVAGAALEALHDRLKPKEPADSDSESGSE